MKKLARYIECALGMLFLVSAAMKAMNVDGFGVSISAYGVIKAPLLVLITAYSTLAIETLLGTALLAGWRGKNLSYLGAILLTGFFSLLIAYAWQVKGLEDCGCFGDYIKLTPPQSLAKNVVVVVLLGFAWIGLRNDKDAEFRPTFSTQLLAVLCATGVVLITVFANTPGTSSNEAPPVASDKDVAYVVPAGSQSYDLIQGEYLVAFLNTECEHCKASVLGLTALAQDESLPPLVALMMGNPESLDTFIISTEAFFPMMIIDELVFMQHIQSAPPILYYSVDGLFKRHWEWEDAPPSPSVIAQDIAAQKE